MGRRSIRAPTACFALALIHELLRAGRIDLDYLVRYTNAHARDRAPGAPTTDCSLRDADGSRCVWYRQTRGARPMPARSPASAGAVRRVHARRRPPRRAVFQLLAERYLGLVRAGRGRGTLRHSGRHDPPHRAEMAHVAFEQTIELPIAWTDCAGRRARRVIGPPGGDARDARHLRALERLPYLPRAAPAADAARRDRRAGQLPLQAAVPASRSRRSKPPGKRVKPDRPLAAARRSASRCAPTICSIDEDGPPLRIDKAFSWEYAARRARHDAHGDRQRLARRPLPDRHAAAVHGQHGVELGDEHAGSHARC